MIFLLRGQELHLIPSAYGADEQLLLLPAHALYKIHWECQRKHWVQLPALRLVVLYCPSYYSGPDFLLSTLGFDNTTVAKTFNSHRLLAAIFYPYRREESCQ
jgi:hypothetical protein